MNVVAFDTLALSQMLRDEAGFDEKQATGLVRAIAASLQDSVASKRDVQDGVAATNAYTEEVRAELEAKILETKVELEAKILETKTELEAKILETRTELLLEIAATNARIDKIEARLGYMQWMLGAIGIGMLSLMFKAFIG